MQVGWVTEKIQICMT